MFKNILTKTVYSKRWMIGIWGVGILALTIFTLLFFPTFSKNTAFSDSLKDAPESLRSFIGDADTYRTIEGYTDVQVLAQMPFMLLIMGIILFTGLLAGEEGDGTLQTLLALPVKRGRVYIEKFIAAMVILGLVCMFLVIGVTIGTIAIGESLNFGRLFQAGIATWLIALVFSSLAYAIGAITGKRGLAGGLAGALAFTSLLITSLAEGVKSLRSVDKLSPFHYFNKPGIMKSGVDWLDLALLAALVVFFVAVALPIFTKRDIYQQ